MPETLAQVLKTDVGLLEAAGSDAGSRFASPAPLPRAQSEEPPARHRRRADRDRRAARRSGDAMKAAEATPAARPPSGWRAWLPWSIAAAAVVAAIVALLWRAALGGKAVPERRLTRTSILHADSPREPWRPGPGRFALSPDGGALVFRASDESGSRLFVRELAETEPRPLAGTDGRLVPVLVGRLAADRLLRRRRAAPGAARRWCRADDLRRQGRSRRRLEPRGHDPLRRRFPGCVPASASRRAAASRSPRRRSTSRRVSAPTASRSFLPDGRHFLFGVEPGQRSDPDPIKVASLDELSTGAAAARRRAPWSASRRRTSSCCTRDEALLVAVDRPRAARDGGRAEACSRSGRCSKAKSRASRSSICRTTEPRCSTPRSIRGRPPSSGSIGTAGSSARAAYEGRNFLQAASRIVATGSRRIGSSREGGGRSGSTISNAAAPLASPLRSSSRMAPSGRRTIARSR